MVQGAKNKFVLSYEGVNTTFTPINWEEFDCVLSRDRLPVDQEVTATIQMIGEAATIITTAYTSGLPLTLSVYRQGNDWQYTDVWTFRADMESYSVDGGVVSVGFMENTVRDEIEKNKGTKYDIEIPNTFQLSYTGITRDRTNTISSGDYADGLLKGLVQRSTSNWLVHGVKSQTTPSDSWIFTDYGNSFYARCLKVNPLSMTFRLGRLRFNVSAPTETDASNTMTLQLLHCRPSGGGFSVRATLWAKSQSPSAYLSYDFTDHTVYTFTHDMTKWQKNGVDLSTEDILVGDFIMLTATIAKRTGVQQYKIRDTPAYLSVVSSDVSNFADYPISVMTIDQVFAALLDKMCTVAVTLDDNINDELEDKPIPVLTSGSALQHVPNPVMSVSFEDVMKFMRCLYAADYDVHGTTITIDKDEAFFDSVNEGREFLSVGKIKREYDPEHVYSKVEAGWETDDDVDCGTQEFLCKTVFEVNKSATDKTLDLVSPFKGSPYTIEQYLNDKSTESEKTRKQDNDVFVFCVEPFIGTTQTTLYRDHTGVDETYFNVPFSPMRFIIANGKYIGVSLYNKTKALTFISSDRKSDVSSDADDDLGLVTENSGTNSVLVSRLATPLFLPETISFETADDVPTKASIDADRHKYNKATDKKTGEIVYFYLNDISLPLTKGKVQQVDGLRTTI